MSRKLKLSLVCFLFILLAGCLSIDAYKQAIRINPDDAEAHYNLGNAYQGLSHYEGAVGALKQAIRINPDYANAHFLLGLVYTKLGRYKEAVEALKQALRIYPDDSEARYWLGVAYLQLENKGNAIDQYKILKTLDKELANKLFNLIYK